MCNVPVFFLVKGGDGEVVSPAVIAVMVVVTVVVAVATQIFENAAIFEAMESI